ncbi:MAG: phosphoribosyltransferase family protein [Bacteroidota bacterium]
MPVPLTLRAGASSAYQALAELAFPTTCLGCRHRLRPVPHQPPLCVACRQAIPPAEPATLAVRFGKLPSPPPLEHLAALWTYDEHGTVAAVQHRLKYGNRPHLGLALGRWVAEALPEGFACDLVVPVPLHRRRVLSRGYNQSATLARGLAARLDADLDLHLLRRARPTRSQTALNHAARWANVDGAFALRRDADVRGSHVLLIDDVLTTGATLAAAARPLIEAGVSVSVAALACTREYV